MTLRMRLLGPVIVVLLSLPAVAATDPVFGRWMVEDGEAVIEIAPCGGDACGEIVWLAEPWSDDGEAKRDVNNPDPAERSRPLCGMRLIEGLTPSGNGAWEDGRIYSARDGRTYGVKIEPDGSERLTVRGYVGISLLGRSQTWERVDGGRGRCTGMRRPGAADR